MRVVRNPSACVWLGLLLMFAVAADFLSTSSGSGSSDISDNSFITAVGLRTGVHPTLAWSATNECFEDAPQTFSSTIFASFGGAQPLSSTTCGLFSSADAMLLPGNDSQFFDHVFIGTAASLTKQDIVLRQPLGWAMYNFDTQVFNVLLAQTPYVVLGGDDDIPVCVNMSDVRRFPACSLTCLHPRDFGSEVWPWSSSNLWRPLISPDATSVALGCLRPRQHQSGDGHSTDWNQSPQLDWTLACAVGVQGGVYEGTMSLTGFVNDSFLAEAEGTLPLAWSRYKNPDEDVLRSLVLLNGATSVTIAHTSYSMMSGQPVILSQSVIS